MEHLLKDTTKIEAFAQIQLNLLDLNPQSLDDDITNLISQIPEQFLNQKEDLMIICHLFAFFTRNGPQINKTIGVRLFDRIMDQIKAQLRDESSFFWQIFGGILYYKLWFYEEGLISIEEIIQRSRNEKDNYIYEYFIPEIKKEEPEVYEKEVLVKLDREFTEKYLNDFQELRKKHFNWLRNSGDRLDPIYQEIERNRLRLAIKTDDIDSFQKILSNSNLSLDMKIEDSIIENFYRPFKKISLIEFAIEFNSIKIFKYLIMNGVKLCLDLIYSATCNRNYEIIHEIENRMNAQFSKCILECSICYWNNEMTEYSFNNYEYDFLEKKDIGTEHDEQIISIFLQSFYSINFMFFNSVLIPFLRNNSKFINSNINNILIQAVNDQTCFFMREFLKFPGVNVNYHSKEDKSLLVYAIEEQNTQAVEELFHYPELDIVNPSSGIYSAFQVACSNRVDMKIIKLFCNHPDFDINWVDSRYTVSAFQLSVTKGNTYATKYLIDNFDHIQNIDSKVLYFYCIENKIFLTLKLILKYFIENNRSKSDMDIVRDFKDTVEDFDSYKEEYSDILRKLLREVRKSILLQ